MCKFQFISLNLKTPSMSQNLSPSTSHHLAVHLHKPGELAAGHGFLSLLTHVPPAPRRFKAAKLPNQTQTSLKITQTTHGFQSHLSWQRSTRSSTIFKLINYSTSKTQPPSVIHSSVHFDLLLEKGITESYLSRDRGNFWLFLSAPFCLPSSLSSNRQHQSAL